MDPVLLVLHVCVCVCFIYMCAAHTVPNCAAFRDIRIGRVNMLT